MLQARHCFFLVLCLAAPPALAGSDAGLTPSTVTLRQCYEWAQARSEVLKSRAEDIVQSKARARAALGGAFPQVGWEWSDTWQDPSGVDQLVAQGFGGFVTKQEQDSDFYLHQPLFSGLREFSARSGFERQSARDALLLQRSHLDLFEQTADDFYQVIALETERANSLATLGLAQDRYQELASFLKLGKSRQSELYTAQARIQALKANLEQLSGRIQSAREELSFITGRDLSAQPLSDEIPDQPAVQALDQALLKVSGRTDLRAQREDLEARRMQVRYERGAYWPNADVTGHYYTQRATYLDAIDWDVIVALRVPLYQGGTVSAHVAEALAAERQSSWRLEEMQRTIYTAVRKTHAELTAALRESAVLGDATAAAQKSYDALREEYRLGLVTNLDVLEALDFLQTQRTAHDDARLRAKELYLSLGAETETLP